MNTSTAMKPPDLILIMDVAVFHNAQHLLLRLSQAPPFQTGVSTEGLLLQNVIVLMKMK
jgi:hypothetical protein